jgi:hypothetical protein
MAAAPIGLTAIGPAIKNRFQSYAKDFKCGDGLMTEGGTVVIPVSARIA